MWTDECRLAFSVVGQWKLSFECQWKLDLGCHGVLSWIILNVGCRGNTIEYWALCANGYWACWVCANENWSLGASVNWASWIGANEDWSFGCQCKLGLVFANEY
jgi:hypothetical protein